MENCSIWLVGLGSDHGDDRAGWEIVSRLRGTLPDRVCVESISDPFALAIIPTECILLVVVDGSRGVGRPGSLYQFNWPDARLIETGGTSSHGFGLVAALQLIEALGRLPQRVAIFAIEGETDQPGAGLSTVVEAAIPEAVTRIARVITATYLAECSEVHG